jgi:hypothetical protein
MPKLILDYSYIEVWKIDELNYALLLCSAFSKEGV